jgi:hypothetical protein
MSVEVKKCLQGDSGTIFVNEIKTFPHGNGKHRIGLV